MGVLKLYKGIYNSKEYNLSILDWSKLVHKSTSVIYSAINDGKSFFQAVGISDENPESASSLVVARDKWLYGIRTS